MTSTLAPTIIAHWEDLAGRPALTWYGPEGERVELGGRILVNWVTKTANFLAFDADRQPGSAIGLDLPPHWRTCVWAWGAWWIGVGVDVVPVRSSSLSDGGTDVVVSDAPDKWDPATLDVVAVALPALARAYQGELPPHAIDAGPAVMGQADAALFTEGNAPSASAVLAPAIAFADLGAWFGDLSAMPLREACASPETSGLRVLIQVASSDSRVGFLRATGAVWQAGGSVVICLTDDQESPVHDGERYARLLEAERITHELTLSDIDAPHA